MTRWLMALALLSLAPTVAPAQAEVRVVRRADGSTYVYNVRTRSLATPDRVSSRVSPRSAESVDAMVRRHAKLVSLEPDLIKAVIQVESAFDPDARSRKGAMGLMQLMPATAAAYSVSDAYDPEQNIEAGTQYLKRLIDSQGSLELGLAAYNAGPGAVQRFGGVPPYPETRNYIEKVMRLYKGDARYSLAGSSLLRKGRKTYLRRDASGRLIMTTSPPSG